MVGAVLPAHRSYLKIVLKKVFIVFPSFSLLICVNKREKDGVKERKSTHCSEVVKDFSAQIYRYKTESKFAPQNLTTSSYSQHLLGATTKLRFVH